VFHHPSPADTTNHPPGAVPLDEMRCEDWPREAVKKPFGLYCDQVKVANQHLMTGQELLSSYGEGWLRDRGYVQAQSPYIEAVQKQLNSRVVALLPLGYGPLYYFNRNAKERENANVIAKFWQSKPEPESLKNTKKHFHNSGTPISFITSKRVKKGELLTLDISKWGQLAAEIDTANPEIPQLEVFSPDRLYAATEALPIKQRQLMKKVKDLGWLGRQNMFFIHDEEQNSHLEADPLAAAAFHDAREALKSEMQAKIEEDDVIVDVLKEEDSNLSELDKEWLKQQMKIEDEKEAKEDLKARKKAFLKRRESMSVVPGCPYLGVEPRGWKTYAKRDYEANELVEITHSLALRMIDVASGPLWEHVMPLSSHWDEKEMHEEFENDFAEYMQAENGEFRSAALEILSEWEAQQKSAEEKSKDTVEGNLKKKTMCFTSN